MGLAPAIRHGGDLVLLNGKSVREVLRVKMPDIWMAALFACVLLLDWLVSLYNALSTNA